MYLRLSLQDHIASRGSVTLRWVAGAECGYAESGSRRPGARARDRCLSSVLQLAEPAVPRIAAGVYTVWHGSRLIYVGMAGGRLGEGISAATGASGSRQRGLWSRLKSHASGRRSGDQFCTYVADRFVLPALDPATIRAIGEGTVSFDELVEAYICEHLSYRFVVTRNGTEAATIERIVKVSGLPDAGRPLLNPDSSARQAIGRRTEAR